ncbi:MAG: NAD-dependent epimerase/dehydratase family protein [Planctomycetes bacterium]|nr:NAD-dependent epimerase/dehydratase family protein [Planctomycetota bacterium]
MLLVTGGGGFIGSAVVRRFLAAGDAVRVLDNFSTGYRHNLDGLSGKLDVIGADLCDPDAARLALRGVDRVVHLAAIPSVTRSVADPGETWRVNVDGTFRLLEAARRAGVKRFVFTSSSSVYGDTPVLPKREDMPVRPLSPYAASKAAGEAVASAYAASFGISAASLRPFNVYGPRQDPGSEYAAAIPRFITALLGRSAPIVYGDGLQTRDFTFVEDAAEAFERAARSEAAGVFNVAAGGRITVLDLIAKIRGICGGPEPEFLPRRPGDVLHSQADVTAAEAAFGFRARTSLEDGLRRTVDWFRGGGR